MKRFASVVVLLALAWLLLNPAGPGVDGSTVQAQGGATMWLPLVGHIPPSPPLPGITTRVSVASDGTQGNDHSGGVNLSADGRYVVFSSVADNLVPNDTNGRADVFVHDRQNGETTRVSVATDGTQADGHSSDARISADGRFVAFTSLASNLVPEDTNAQRDVFVHDRQTHLTTRVSVSSNGGQATAGSWVPSISGDGRFVAFHSGATNLVPGWSVGLPYVYVHDRQTGQTIPASVSMSGGPPDGHALTPSISLDGRFVTFISSASNIAPGGMAGNDIYVRDLLLGENHLISRADDGGPANGESTWPAISHDGRYVLFSSEASNIVPGDTNGVEDVFVADRVENTIVRVSVSSDGSEGDGPSVRGAISPDGRYTVFSSTATNLVPYDYNDYQDVFVHDLLMHETSLISRAPHGASANLDSHAASLSYDGRFVGYTSGASNLVPGDTNLVGDVFVYDQTPGAP